MGPAAIGDPVAGIAIADSGRAALRQLLVSSYDDLKRRLTRHYGSLDEATEVPHETWLWLGQFTEPVTIQRPHSCFYRMALNVAVDRHRAGSRSFGKAELQALLYADDDQIDPERLIAMRSEISAQKRRLAQLPLPSRPLEMPWASTPAMPLKRQRAIKSAKGIGSHFM